MPAPPTASAEPPPPNSLDAAAARSPLERTLSGLKAHIPQPAKVAASDSLTGPTKAWAVVTGPSSGIGREFALALAERGTPVLAVAHNCESPRTDTALKPSEPAVR